jgi:hypothetical protein
MTKIRLIAAFIIIWSAAMALALTLGITFDWPDYVHVNYGFPMVWATHVLNTIHGPVDIWQVYVLSLLLDLVFWSVSLLAGVILVMHFLRRNGEKER